jgi:hypothetical protein
VVEGPLLDLLAFFSDPNSNSWESTSTLPKILCWSVANGVCKALAGQFANLCVDVLSEKTCTPSLPASAGRCIFAAAAKTATGVVVKKFEKGVVEMWRQQKEAKANITSFLEWCALPPKATHQQVQFAYRQKARALHPDKNHNGNDDAFKELQTRYRSYCDAVAVLEGADSPTAKIFYHALKLVQGIYDYIVHRGSELPTAVRTLFDEAINTLCMKESLSLIVTAKRILLLEEEKRLLRALI